MSLNFCGQGQLLKVQDIKCLALRNIFFGVFNDEFK